MKNMSLKEQLALYQETAEKNLKLVIDKYVKFNFELYDVFDKETGSIYLTDKDSVLLNSKYKEHPIFKIFDIDCIENYRKYTCNMNDRILLRGPQNYYFGFCYLGDLDVENEQIVNTLEYVKKFIVITKNEKYEEFNYENILDVKTILAIIDVIRNSLITNLFFCLMKENNIKDIYVYDEGENILANEFYNLLKKVENKIYDIVLEQKYRLIERFDEIINEFLMLQTTLIKEIKENKNDYKNDLYIRYRKSREADCGIENIICIKYAIEEILREKKELISENDLYILGLNYGSIELIAIADILLKKNGISHISGNIMRKFRKVYVEADNKQKNITNNKIEKNAYYIILDENIMTGQTLENAKKYLENFNLKLLDTIIIKYPTIARVKNIANVKDCKYLELLKNIKGILVPTNYSKLCEYRNDFIFPYMDMLGTFDLYKYEVLKNLYKNGEYIKESAVGRVEKYYENIFF
jgi:hypothetical protein